MPIRSEWNAIASWPYDLPETEPEVRAFVERLRRHVIRDEKQQNDVDEACHLIEVLWRKTLPR